MGLQRPPERWTSRNSYEPVQLYVVNLCSCPHGYSEYSCNLQFLYAQVNRACDESQCYRTPYFFYHTAVQSGTAVYRPSSFVPRRLINIQSRSTQTRPAVTVIHV